MTEATIVVSGLRKRFGATTALEGMRFSHLVVGRGRVIALTRDAVEYRAEEAAR
jgi:hypothetical protein